MAVNRVFLSHSSVDKDFVRLVKEAFGDAAIIDEVDFAAGARTMDEIVEKIGDSKIFVAFLSKEALDSEWVQKELAMAIEHMESKDLDLLIFRLDNVATYTNTKIPEKLRKNYNIRPAISPEMVISRIRERIKMFELRNNPALREAENLFIGRSDLVSRFESEFSTLDSSRPTFIVASNYYKGMGRRKFCTHTLGRTGLLKGTQEPITITLTKGESIENYILKLNSYLGSDADVVESLYQLSPERKIEKAIEMTKEYKRNSRLIFIQDRGAIVLPNHQMVDWFYSLTQAPALKNNVTFCLISDFEPNFRYLIGENRGMAFHVTELNKPETRNLFLLLLDIWGIGTTLSAEDKQKFIDKLTGIPAQIKFIVQLIKAVKPFTALQNLDQISDYYDSFSSSLLEAVQKNKLALDVALLLSDGPLSLSVLGDVFADDELTQAIKYLKEYSALDLIEEDSVVATLNSTFADFLKRRRLRPSAEVEAKFQKVISGYASRGLDNLIKDDFSRFMATLDSLVKGGKEIPKKYFLAPLLINNIIKDYYAGNYDRVETLCKRLLDQRNVDPQVTWELQYHLVRVYARTGNEKFWGALHNSDLSHKDKNFLQGFYYRNRYSREDNELALAFFLDVLAEDPHHSRALREIVNTYILLDEYREALKYAKDNYLNNPKDILHLQSYFASLIRIGESGHEDTLNELIEAAENNADPRSVDVLRCMKGEYAYWVEKDLAKAERLLNDAFRHNDNKRFPLKALIAIYKNAGELAKIKETKNLLSRL